MIKHKNEEISVRKKCLLLGINRSQIYYQTNINNNDKVVKKINVIFEKHPFYGYRRIHATLTRAGLAINKKKVQRLMQVNGIKAIYPKKKLSVKNKTHKIYSYLLRDIEINRPNKVWQTDITYIKIRNGFLYLAGIIDVYSRKIVGWHVSPFIDTQLCMQTLFKALPNGKPDILNSDQGCQFTSDLWTATLEKNKIKISMDGKGKWADNITIERFWRSLKYESIFLHSFDNVEQATNAINDYINFYNNIRPHQTLGYKTPNEVYIKSKGKRWNNVFLGNSPTKDEFKNSHKPSFFWS